jgi:hypothetical protein
MTHKPKPVYLVERPGPRPNLTLTPEEASWTKVFWRWFGWGGFAAWMGCGWLFNQVLDNLDGGIWLLTSIGICVLALVLTGVMAGIGIMQADKATGQR